MFIHVRPSSHGSKVGALLLHSQDGGDAVLLQVSEDVPKQSEESKQEQAGCNGDTVEFKHNRPVSHTVKFGALKEHSQRAGVVELLHVSALSRHSEESRQEQPGCPVYSVVVVFKQKLPGAGVIGHAS